MVKMTITWHTSELYADRVCPICLPLDGHTWTFDNTKEPFPTELWSPFHNIRVWDCLLDQRRPHGEKRFHCRCSLTVVWDYTYEEDKLRELLDKALDRYGKLEQAGTRLVLRRQGRYVTWRPIT